MSFNKGECKMDELFEVYSISSKILQYSGKLHFPKSKFKSNNPETDTT